MFLLSFDPFYVYFGFTHKFGASILPLEVRRPMSDWIEREIERKDTEQKASQREIENRRFEREENLRCAPAAFTALKSAVQSDVVAYNSHFPDAMKTLKYEERGKHEFIVSRGYDPSYLLTVVFKEDIPSISYGIEVAGPTGDAVKLTEKFGIRCGANETFVLIDQGLSVTAQKASEKLLLPAIRGYQGLG